MPLVFPRLFPFLVNCGMTLGESWKKQVGERKAEQRCGLRTESPQKGFHGGDESAGAGVRQTAL